MPSSLPRVCIIMPNRPCAGRDLGQALADRLPNVTLADTPDPDADIIYYVDPVLCDTGGSTLRIGWFADLPETVQDPSSLRKLVAQMDAVIAPTQTLCDRLRATGATQDFMIAHGTTPADYDANAQAHQILFQKLAHTSAPIPVSQNLSGSPVRLLLHGGEHKTLGGPTVRVPRTADALRDIGLQAHASHFDGQAAGISEDIVHLFNVWPPDSALHALHSLKQAGKKVVFSPIYLDLGMRDFWQFELPRSADMNPDELSRRYGAYRTHIAGRGRLSEIVPGYNAMLREMLALADHVIFLSTAERDALAHLGAQVEPDRSSLIANPVDLDLWTRGDPDLFRTTYLEGLSGPRDYVICVARIEERKNQLMLVRALRDLPVRLVLVGHQGSPEYAAQIQRAAGPDILMLGRIDPASAMLRSALTGARAFALPSWAEGASLAALEAAACGTALVLSTCSSEQAYFGDFAEYCDPADVRDIRAALERALGQENTAQRRAALHKRLQVNNSWPQHAKSTAAAYSKALEAAPAPAAHQPTHRPAPWCSIWSLTSRPVTPLAAVTGS